MAILSVTITESAEQIVSGIPKYVTISTNIPSTIFYTLDGTIPTLDSNIYTSPILMPTNLLSVQLQVLATDGIIFSSIISEDYGTNILNNTRLSHSSNTAPVGSNLPNLYPFGTNQSQPTSQFLNPAEASININDPNLTQIPTGYDGAGAETGFTNKPYDLENYNIIYSTHYPTGESIGTLPASVTISKEEAPPDESNHFSKLFDPRALVIFQDVSKENPEDPPMINKQYFSFENDAKTKDGVNYFNSGLDAPTVMGSFVRSHYNPRDNTITYYYLDTHINKWIISKTPYQQTGSFDGNLSTAYMSKNTGVGVVFKWYPHMRRVLF